MRLPLIVPSLVLLSAVPIACEAQAPDSVRRDSSAVWSLTTRLYFTKHDTVKVPVPPPPPQTACVRTVNVNTMAGLNTAIAAQVPGDCITLAAGSYTRTSGLTISRSGTAAQPITIQGGGSVNTVIDFGATALYLKASYIRLQKLRLTHLNSQAIWCQGATYDVFDSLQVDNVTHAAIRFRDASHHNIVQHSLFENTGTVYPYYGEAIYVGNSGSNTNDPVQTTNTYNQVLNNHFGPNVRAQAVDVKPGSDHTTIRGNTVDGTGAEWWPDKGSAFLIGVAANYTVIDGNTLQYGNPHGMAFFEQLPPMVGNIVSNNTIDLQNIHNVTDRPFYGFYLAMSSPSPAKVTVKCSNTVTNGAFSNVACVP